MSWSFVLFDSVTILLILVFEKSFLKKTKNKGEKFVFLGFLFIGFVISLLLTIYPNLPGPSEWIESIFQPLGRRLEK